MLDLEYQLLSFGIASFDELLGRSQAAKEPQYHGIYVDKGHTTSLCLIGPDGTGKSILALHLAAQGGSVEVVRTLLDLGADPSVVEPAFNGTPAQWAEHFEHEAARELLNDTSHPNPPPQGGRA